MKIVFDFIRDTVVYGSVATVLGLLLLVAYVWTQYGFNKDKAFHVLTAVYEVDVAEMQAREIIAQQRGDQEDVAYEEVLHERTMLSLDHDLREQAINKGLADFRLLQRDLMEERRRYDLLKNAFDAELKQLKSVAADNAIVELQLTLETIKPEQAKDHIVRMLPPGFVNTDFSEMDEEERTAIIHVVAILKAMPLEKRKKLLAEFKSEEDAEILAELLRLIRLGVPEVGLIEATRGQLQQFNAN